jgi:hypothetical protein
LPHTYNFKISGTYNLANHFINTHVMIMCAYWHVHLYSVEFQEHP